MTVQALIKYLRKFPPRAQVVMSHDAEGNGFSPLSGVELCKYIEFSSWSGEIVANEEEESGHTAVCLWPIN